MYSFQDLTFLYGLNVKAMAFSEVITCPRNALTFSFEKSLAMASNNVFRISLRNCLYAFSYINFSCLVIFPFIEVQSSSIHAKLLLTLLSKHVLHIVLILGLFELFRNTSFPDNRFDSSSPS